MWCFLLQQAESALHFHTGLQSLGARPTEISVGKIGKLLFIGGNIYRNFGTLMAPTLGYTVKKCRALE